MNLAGRGIVAIWHDILLEGQAEFYEWHNREHMPERMGIPGFRRGRRYIAVHGTPQFFCFYEGEDLGVVVGPAYLERLNNPSEWTRTSWPGYGPGIPGCEAGLNPLTTRYLGSTGGLASRGEVAATCKKERRSTKL